MNHRSLVHIQVIFRLMNKSNNKTRNGNFTMKIFQRPPEIVRIKYVCNLFDIVGRSFIVN